ncbi:MAG: phosphatidylglycerol lysyltransferase domain-containing protein [Oscillospiraceae bacterium]|nr:phosphatidylglycerol lysyltransferase domain-containing protein [Oscillospiraceae bacterium]
MLEFKKLELSDIDKVKHYFGFSTNRICDNSVGAAFMWRDFFSVEYAIYNDTIIFKSKVVYSNNITAFSFPLGKDIVGILEKAVAYCRLNNLRISFHTITSAEIDLLETIFPDFEVFKEPDWSDYVYHVEDLRTLKGRKYNGQRNHMNFFKKNFPDYAFRELSADNIPQVMDFFVRLSSINLDTPVAKEEHHKVIEVLENYDAYGCFGGVLTVSGKVVAFAVGENINDVMFVHIEKGDIQYRGAYQMINNALIKHFATDQIKFINREEDVGDPGLRNAKRAYHPCEILDKYIFLVM